MPPATDEIWREFGSRLGRFIRKRAQNDEDGEDILQDVFCKIHGNIHKLQDEEKLPAWIYAVARNTIVDFYRRRKPAATLKDASRTIAERPDASAAVDPHREIASCLTPMVEKLPEKYRRAILLTEFQGLTQKEMAKELGLSVPGAKSRVQRARQRLKEMLLACCHFEFDRTGKVLSYEAKEGACRQCGLEASGE